ncbi:MAG: single-stranded DNA-binding protein [Phycisphaerales bacterium]|nr:single-stranded DNA-binding protein [Phycisphaerales bacterium]
MASFNRVILAGNLTRDPQLSYTPSNTPVCEFGLASNRRWRDRDGNNKDEVCFVDLIAYGRQAEVINQYMTKGRSILIEGRLRYRQWTNKEGQNRNKMDVVVETFTFLGSGPGGGPSRGPSGPAPAATDNEPPVYDDDIPPPDPNIPF